MNCFFKARRLTQELQAMQIDNARDYKRMSKRVDSSLVELRAAWNDPCVGSEAAMVRADLIAAWDSALPGL